MIYVYIKQYLVVNYVIELNFFTTTLRNLTVSCVVGTGFGE